jgi:hypothetical protein
MRKLFFLAGLFLLGCAAPRGQWTYAAEPFRSDAPLVDAVVVVPTFEDHRVPADAGWPILSVVPLVPWSDISSAIPEARWDITFVPDVDLPRALADEVENARIFRAARFTGAPEPADYVLEGSLTATDFRYRELSYGVAAYSVFVWMAGAPAGVVQNALRVDLTLRRANDPHIVWSHSVDEAVRDVTFIHELPADTYRFDELWKRALQQALPSLRAAVETIPRD